MPNVGDIIRAADFSGAGIKAGAVVPFYNVTLSGRYPIFWGESEADTSWLVCDGGSDLHGGNVPNLSNRFIMGVTSVSALQALVRLKRLAAVRQLHQRVQAVLLVLRLLQALQVVHTII